MLDYSKVWLKFCRVLGPSPPPWLKPCMVIALLAIFILDTLMSICFYHWNIFMTSTYTNGKSNCPLWDSLFFPRFEVFLLRWSLVWLMSSDCILRGCGKVECLHGLCISSHILTGLRMVAALHGFVFLVIKITQPVILNWPTKQTTDLPNHTSNIWSNGILWRGILPLLFVPKGLGLWGCYFESYLPLKLLAHWSHGVALCSYRLMVANG